MAAIHNVLCSLVEFVPVTERREYREVRMSEQASSGGADRTGMAAAVRTRLRRFSPVGLAVALVFFAWSMTPSLLPRPWYLQSVATGLSVVIGYGIGAGVAALARAAGSAPRGRRACAASDGACSRSLPR